MLSRQPLCLPASKYPLVWGIAACLLAFTSGHGFAETTGGQTAAGDLTVQAIGTETGTWSSNPLMVVRGAKPLMGSTTSPQLIIRSETPASLASLDTKIDHNIFNQSAYDSTDVHATANLSKQNQRWATGLQSRVNYDTTRTSELTNYGLAPVIARHFGLTFTPQISFNPSAVDTLSLSGSTTLSQYDKNIFTNYQTYSVTPSYMHRFDPRNAGVFSLQAQQYRTTRNNASRIHSLGPSIGWQTIFSPRFNANASVGTQTSRQYNFGKATGPWTWEYVFSGGLSFKGLQDTVNFTTSRAQFPYGNGTEALQTSISLKESHALNPLFSLNFGADYRSSAYQTSTPGNLKTLAGGSVGTSYHATQAIDLTATYQYRHETLTNQTKTAQDNSIMVGLAYHPEMWTLGE